MLRSYLSLVSLVVAGPALAQSGAAPSPQNTMPPPEFMTAAQGFGQCLGRMVQPGGAAAAESVPEAAAHAALAGCVKEKAALDTRFEAWITGPSFPAAGRTPARAQYKAQMDGVEAKLAGQMRAALAAQTPAPAAAPTPVPSPTPHSGR